MTEIVKNKKAPGRLAEVLACALVLVLCIGWLYRFQLSNGFSLLAGDRYDGIISTTILEHWYKVYHGKANWLEVGYFFPHTRVIAQSDAYFLIGILYTPFRLLGFDQFVSAELANMLVKAIGFASAYIMCRRVFSMSFYWALLAAVLFTLSNGMTVHSSRSQLATVAFTPIMVLLLWQAGKGLAENQISRFRKYGACAGVLFGAWCLTCFYASWFFFFFAFVFFLVIAFRGGLSGIALARQSLAEHYKSYALVLGVALMALLPFLYAYVPKSQETGVREYSEALRFTVPLENVLQVGRENLFLGKLYNKVLLQLEPGYAPQNEYYNTGFAIVLFGLFLLGAIHLFKRGWAKRDFFLVGIMITTLLTWALTLNVNGYSAWYYAFHLIPGARALRVVAAYHVFLALPVIVIAIHYLSGRNLKMPAMLVLATLLVVEELNVPGLGLDRQAELARIALPSSPPSQCRSFYTSGWKDQSVLAGPAEIYAHNVSAMLIAQTVDIPTVNGVASFQSRDWDFANPGRPDYDARVASYASKNKLTGLCRLDLNNKTWKVIDQSDIRLMPIAVNFFETSAWPGGIAELSGTSPQEHWGAWSNDDVVKLEFTMPLPEKFELHITGHAFAHNIGKEFLVQLAGASGSVEKFVMNGTTDEERVLHFENPGQSSVISIRVPHPVSPSELGAPGDERRLGIAIMKMKVVPL